jgi:hypothetical protein
MTARSVATKETIMSTSKPQPADISPSMQMMQFLWPAAMAVQAIHVAARLGLADLVASGPKTVTQLAAEASAHGPSLGRFLRALTSLGIFAEDPDGRYHQTALSETLRADHPESVRRWAMMLGARFVWAPCGELDVAIRTGQPSFEHVYGTQFFKHLAAHQDDAAVFNAAMSSVPAWVAAIADAYDFSTFEQIVDVGGGHGALIVGILSANPHLRGILYDLPGVVAGASAAREGATIDRCDIVGGDFFERVPAGADAYLLSGIIHDWNDEAAVKILRNCRDAIRANGTLLLLDTVLIPSSDPARALMDLLMMVLTGGRERTEAEFRSLLEAASFSLARVISTPGASIIEARPV